MRYKELGNTGMKVSALAAGTWGIGGAGWGNISREESITAIRTALDCGVNVIDTAPVYGFGNPQLADFGYGCAEALLREAIGDRRSQLILTTKCGLNYDRALGPRSLYRRMTRKEILEGCEGSLRRLGTGLYRRSVHPLARPSDPSGGGHGGYAALAGAGKNPPVRPVEFYA